MADGLTGELIVSRAMLVRETNACRHIRGGQISNMYQPRLRGSREWNTKSSARMMNRSCLLIPPRALRDSELRQARCNEIASDL